MDSKKHSIFCKYVSCFTPLFSFSSKKISFFKQRTVNVRDVPRFRQQMVGFKGPGYSAKKLKDGGFPAWAVKAAGYSITEMKEAGYSSRALKNAGFSRDDIDAEFK
jgi:hypothetical protein